MHSMNNIAAFGWNKAMLNEKYSSIYTRFPKLDFSRIEFIANNIYTLIGKG